MLYCSLEGPVSKDGSSLVSIEIVTTLYRVVVTRIGKDRIETTIVTSFSKVVATTLEAFEDFEASSFFAIGFFELTEEMSYRVDAISLGFDDSKIVSFLVTNFVPPDFLLFVLVAIDSIGKVFCLSNDFLFRDIIILSFVLQGVLSRFFNFFNGLVEQWVLPPWVVKWPT
ncbi:hypothetical protein PanWU01x14_152810 [Parasponia andersonii]|uniref:Uncharacterized protein n=1 Tax=Parasponia andersonii TaxID=3476 RepID=A0A2P5CHI0_PARAD|nr:hypothetical protein PanWU01x14_152810 [Parasponia andersonii]